MMTTHTEDAMTRERALEEVALAIHNARFAHPLHPREPDPFIDKVDREYAFRLARAVFPALASAQQGPAPAADAVEARVDDAEVMRIWREVGLPEYFLGNGGTNTKLVAFAAALRRYAGDSGVTEQRSEEALEDAAVQLEARAYDLEHLYEKPALADEIGDIAQELRARAAARAKSGEKGRAR